MRIKRTEQSYTVSEIPFDSPMPSERQSNILDTEPDQKEQIQHQTHEDTVAIVTE